MGDFFLFKNYHFATEFRGRVDFFFLRFGSEVFDVVVVAVLLLRLVQFFCFLFCFVLFFLASTTGEVFFPQKTSMPPGYQMARP